MQKSTGHKKSHKEVLFCFCWCDEVTIAQTQKSEQQKQSEKIEWYRYRDQRPTIIPPAPFHLDNPRYPGGQTSEQNVIIQTTVNVRWIWVASGRPLIFPSQSNVSDKKNNFVDKRQRSTGRNYRRLSLSVGFRDYRVSQSVRQSLRYRDCKLNTDPSRCECGRPLSMILSK